MSYRNGILWMASAMTPLRVCVVGAGSISREFALHHFGPATGTVVTSVIDCDADRAQQLAVDVGSMQAGASVRATAGNRYSATPSSTCGAAVGHSTELLSGLPNADIVYVGATPAAHASLVLLAIGAGKHVLLEKPLACSATDADAIVSADEAARGVFVGMDIGMRWNPALHQMRRMALVDRELGELRSGRLTLHFRQWPRVWQKQEWCAKRAEGGPLREVGTHFIFALLELFGPGCVQRVRATVQYPDGPQGDAAEESAEGVIQLRSGLLIQLDIKTNLGGAADDVYELEVAGENGGLTLEDFTELSRHTAPGGRREMLVQDGTYGREECVQELVAAVRRGCGPAGVSAREGRDAQRVLDAIYSSGGEWLDVSFD